MDDGQNVKKEAMEVSSNLKTLPFIFKERIDNMTDYPSNSNKSKEEVIPDIPDAVVITPAMRRKKKDSKFLRMIFKQDFKDVKPGLVKGYIEPKVQDLAWSFIQASIDTVTNALRMMVYKDYTPVNTPKLPADRYSYSSYPSASAPRQNLTPTMTNEINYDDFTYATKGEADVVLAELKNILQRSNAATVLDLYGLSGVGTSNYTLQNWGWKDLNFAEVKQTFDEDHRIVYMISLPKAIFLGR